MMISRYYVEYVSGRRAYLVIYRDVEVAAYTFKSDAQDYADYLNSQEDEEDYILSPNSF